MGVALGRSRRLRGGAGGGIAYRLVAVPTRYAIHGRHRPVDHRDRRAPDFRPPYPPRGPCLYLPAMAPVHRHRGHLRRVRRGRDQVRGRRARHGRGGGPLGLHPRPLQDRRRPHGGFGRMRRRHSRAVQLNAARNRRRGALHLLCGGREMGTRRAGLPAGGLPRRGIRHGPAPRGAVDRRPHGPVLPHARRQARQARQAQGAHGGHVDLGRMHAQPLRREAAHGAVRHHGRGIAEIRGHRRARAVDRGGARPGGRRVHPRGGAAPVPPPGAPPRRGPGASRGR